MAYEHLRYPQWRHQNEDTTYPFRAGATLTNGTQTILEGTFLDLVVYVAGLEGRAYLAVVEIDHEEVTLHFGDPRGRRRARAVFPLINPPDTVPIVDERDRPAGLVVSESVRLAAFQSWGVGEHVFSPAQTELAASTVIPMPEPGVRGLELDDGTILTGDVWLVGGSGVILETETLDVPELGSIPAIFVHAVGDPLFRRHLCNDENLGEQLFQTPRFVRALQVQDGTDTVKVTPDARGNIRISANNAQAEDTILRVRQEDRGLSVAGVGKQLEPRGG